MHTICDHICKRSLWMIASRQFWCQKDNIDSVQPGKIICDGSRFASSDNEFPHQLCKVSVFNIASFISHLSVYHGVHINIILECVFWEIFHTKQTSKLITHGMVQTLHLPVIVNTVSFIYTSQVLFFSGDRSIKIISGVIAM